MDVLLLGAVLLLALVAGLVAWNRRTALAHCDFRDAILRGEGDDLVRVRFDPAMRLTSFPPSPGLVGLDQSANAEVRKIFERARSGAASARSRCGCRTAAASCGSCSSSSPWTSPAPSPAGVGRCRCDVSGVVRPWDPRVQHGFGFEKKSKFLTETPRPPFPTTTTMTTVAAISQLVAIGSIDAELTQSPTVTYWRYSPTATRTSVSRTSSSSWWATSSSAAPAPPARSTAAATS